MILVDGQESLAVIVDDRDSGYGRRLLAQLPNSELDFWTLNVDLERHLHIESPENDVDGLYTATLLPREDELSFQVQLVEVDRPKRGVVRPDTGGSPVI